MSIRLTRLATMALLAAVGAMVVAGAPALAQEARALDQPDLVEAIVTDVLEDGMVAGPDGRSQPYQRLAMRLLDGPDAGSTIEVEHGQFAAVNVPRYGRGDRVLLSPQPQPDGTTAYFVAEAVRSHVLLLLSVVFVVLTIAVGRLRGAASVLSMAVSFAVIFLFILPRLAAGADPVTTAIAGSAVIIPFSYYVSHGLNRKTSAAVVGTLIALVLTALLAQAAIAAAKLTGYSSEEALVLQSTAAVPFDMRGLLMASIIIGLLGVLDDITVSQAAIVNQLRLAAPDMPASEAIRRAMDVGTDHIASLVNTLVLVYASTALPLLLLFTSATAPFRELINYEIVAEEVVRALVASIGLILAVPLTTVVATMAGVGLDGADRERAADDDHAGG